MIYSQSTSHKILKLPSLFKCLFYRGSRYAAQFKVEKYSFCDVLAFRAAKLVFPFSLTSMIIRTYLFYGDIYIYVIYLSIVITIKMF